MSLNYRVRRTSQFKKGYKRTIKRGLPIEELDETIETLATDGYLPARYNDHPLVGYMKGL